MLKQLEIPSLTSIGLSNSFKPSQIQASNGDFLAVNENDTIHFIQSNPPQIITKIPNKVNLALSHPTIKGHVVIKNDQFITIMDSINKQQICKADIPSNSGTTLQIKFINKQLHLITTTGIYKYNEDLTKCSLICKSNDVIPNDKVIITSFSGCCETNIYALSTLAEGKAKTLIFNQKISVIPDVISSTVISIGWCTYVATAPLNSMKVKIVNLTQMKPAEIVLSEEAKEIIKYIVPLHQYGIVAMFSSLLHVYIIDIFTCKLLTQLQTASQVVFTQATISDSLLYIQQDGKITVLQPETNLLISTLQSKLSAIEQYQHFVSTQLFGGQVQFGKVCQTYMEDCFKTNNFKELSKIVADAIQFGDQTIRKQQLIDKISLSSDRKGFLVFATTLAQQYKIKLNIQETIALLRCLQQESLLTSAFPKFLDGDYIELESGNEQVGQLILDLAGTPVPQDYSHLALQCFQKYQCHVRVLQFFLKNATIQTALDYVAKLQDISNLNNFSFVNFIKEKYQNDFSNLRGDTKFAAQNECVKIMGSNQIPFEEKEILILDIMISLELNQQVIQYLTTLLKTQNNEQTQTLFVKVLLNSSKEEMGKIKQNLLIGLKNPLKLSNKKSIIEYCLEKNFQDLALLLAVESQNEQLLSKMDALNISDVQEFETLLNFIPQNQAINDVKFIQCISDLVQKTSTDSTVFCIFKLLIQYIDDLELVEKINNLEQRLAIELQRKLSKGGETDQQVFLQLFEQIIVQKRSESSPLSNITQLLELLVKNKETIPSLTLKLQNIIKSKDDLDNDQQAKVANLFGFLIVITHIYTNCSICQSKQLQQCAGECVYDNKQCIEEMLKDASEFCEKSTIIKSFINQIGFQTKEKQQTKFFRLGSFTLYNSLLLVLVQEEMYECVNIIIQDSCQQISNNQSFYVLSHLLESITADNINQIIKTMEIVIQQSQTQIIKYTYASIQSILFLVIGKLTETLKIDFNFLDPDVILNSLKKIEVLILEKQDTIIGPTTQMLNILSILPSQPAEQYLIYIIEKTYKLTENKMLLTKLADVAINKQDSGFWQNILIALPEIISVIGEMGIEINAVKILSLIQASLSQDVCEINYKHLKHLFIQLLPQTQDKKFAQNLLIQLDIKMGDEDQVADDIKKYSDSVTISSANLCIENKMFTAASLIFKLLNNHVDAVSCLLNNNLESQAQKYAKEVNDGNSWRLLCKHYLQTDTQKAFECLKQTNQLIMSNDVAQQVIKSENYELHYDLSQYMISHRLSDQDKYVDSDLALLFATLMHKEFQQDQVKLQLATILQDPSTPANPQKLGDHCFVREMFKPARLFYAAARNYVAMNSVCLRVGDYLGAIQATSKLNTPEVWQNLRNELLSLSCSNDEIDKSKLLYLFIAQLNLLNSNEEIVYVNGLPLEIRHQIVRIACEIKAKGEDHSKHNASQLDNNLARITRSTMADFDTEAQNNFANIISIIINPINDQIFNIMVGIYAGSESVQNKLLDFLKQYVKHVNIEFALQQATKHELFECVTFCRCAMGQGDEAAKNIIANNGNVEQLFKLLQLSDQKPLHALAFKFVIDKHLQEFTKFQQQFDKFLTPAEQMQILGLIEDGEEKLYECYFVKKVINAEQVVDDVAVNNKFISYIIKKEMLPEMKIVVNKINNYDKLGTAQRLEGMKLFRDVAATIYNQIQLCEKCVQILIEDNNIDQAMSEVEKTKNREAAKLLLEFASESNSENLIQVLKIVESVLRLDQLMGICYKNGKMDIAMPFIISNVGRICEKLEKQANKE